MHAAVGRPEPATVDAPEPFSSPREAWEEGIDAAFRRYREAAVRLVEQVRDNLDPEDEGAPFPPADLHLVRSVFGKWSIEILLALHATPSAGFEDLRRSLSDISARVLSIKLRDLEENAMIRREIIDTRPPRVRYSLTDRGWTVAWLAQPIFLYLRTCANPSTPRTDPGLAATSPAPRPARSGPTTEPLASRRSPTRPRPRP